MANLKSSKKDVLRSRKNRLINREAKQNIKNLKKTIYNMALNKQSAEAEKLFPQLISAMGKAAKKNIYTKNKMARTVSRFHLKMKDMGCFK
jgi:small subunit ribosomal protein S20